MKAFARLIVVLALIALVVAHYPLDDRIGIADRNLCNVCAQLTKKTMRTSGQIAQIFRGRMSPNGDCVSHEECGFNEICCPVSGGKGKCLYGLFEKNTH